MKSAGRFAIIALSALVLCSCDSHRNMRIESNVRAEVIDWGGNLICVSTPCVMHVSRETCRFFDSSSGYIILTARSRTGILMRSMAIPTCSITDDMWIMFSFPGPGMPGLPVIRYEGDREKLRLAMRSHPTRTDAPKK